MKNNSYIVYLEKHEQLAFIKPSDYEIGKTRKYKTDIISNLDKLFFSPSLISIIWTFSFILGLCI
ncbi:MAG: hypothetical protein Q8900_10310 [Bacillota bacterium]|nr:hypothetical protein [Bacillota bacterium]